MQYSSQMCQATNLLPGPKNRENNPMQSRMHPTQQHACCAASGLKPNWFVVTAPN